MLRQVTKIGSRNLERKASPEHQMKVVYFLGAGFSAPLGLPVTSNFLRIANDIYKHQPRRYKHFGEVLDLFNGLSRVKNFYRSNLFNIEEVFSILEMDAAVRKSNISRRFGRFISEVVDWHTPDPGHLTYHNDPGTPWHNDDFINCLGREPIHQLFGFFFLSLFGFTIEDIGRTESVDLAFKSSPSKVGKYAIVTPNYDTVPETFSDFFERYYHSKDRFRRPGERSGSVRLAKLHGSIGGDIIPPTWNKSLHPHITQEWQLAFKVLQQAEHIRVVGYSLPELDAYVRYLFKAAVWQSDNLQKIDVLCLDPNGDVKTRWDEFVDFQYYRFRNINFEDYLQYLWKHSRREKSHWGATWYLQFDIEEAHEQFMVEAKN